MNSYNTPRSVNKKPAGKNAKLNIREVCMNHRRKAKSRKIWNKARVMLITNTTLIGIVSLMLVIPKPLPAIEETKLKMEIWARHTVEYTENADELDMNQIAIKRGYLRFEPKFSDMIKGRFNIDFFASDDSHDGAGIKLKYAYLDFNNLLLAESKITFGLMKHYFGTIYDWNYTTIQKALEDKEKVVSSTDYGLGLYGYVPGGYGEYFIGTYNGEGYKKTGSAVNIMPTASANLRIIPFPGITVGGSVLYEKAGFKDTIQTEFVDRLCYAGVGRFAFGPFDILGEFLVKDYDDVQSMGFMVMPVLKLRRFTDLDVDLVGRFDQWDKNKDANDDMYRRYIGGFNWYLIRDRKGKPIVMIQIQGEGKEYEDDSKPMEYEGAIQLRWIFGHKIKG